VSSAGAGAGGAAQLLQLGALSVSPDGTRLLVTDIAPAAQQVKMFDAATGALLRTFGRAGGYVAPLAGPDVGPDRFWFQPVPPGNPRHAPPSGSAVAWAPDGASFWVTDQGNRRVLRLAVADGAQLDAIGWLLASYKSAVVRAEPSRVFSNFLEFAVDHALPPGAPGAWTLVRNWGAGLGPQFRPWDPSQGDWGFVGFEHVVTLLDAARGINRSFSAVSYLPHAPANESDQTMALVELVPAGSPASGLCPSAPQQPGPAGGLRVLQVFDGRAHPEGLGAFEPDGSLRFAATVNDPVAGVFWQGIYARQPAFDAAGCPSWFAAPPVLLASFNVSANNSQSLMARGSMSTPRMPTTAGGYTAVFDASRDVNGGFHLGAVQAAADGGPGAGWAWWASPFGTWRLVDNVQTLQPGNVSVNLRYINASDVDGRFGSNNSGTNYAGSVVMAEGTSLVYGYYGEGWYASEANQMLHWHESGLFLGQFGTPAAPYPEGNTIYASPGVAGNTFSPSLARAVGADGAEHLYVFTNEEVEHGAVHRWRIDGADAVQELQVALAPKADA